MCYNSFEIIKEACHMNRNNKRIKIGKVYYSLKAAKMFVTIITILAIILIVLGLLLCLVTLIFGIPAVAFGVFLIFYSRNLKTIINNQINSDATTNKANIVSSTDCINNSITTPISTPSTSPEVKHIDINKAVKNTIPESEKNYDLFFIYDDDNYLAYQYEENLAFPAIDMLTGNGGKVIKFVQEPNNQYDNTAIAVFLEEQKVGYLYRGQTKDMVNDWIKHNSFFWGYINKIDATNNKATIKIGFYKNIDSLSSKKFKLIKISKKADEFSSSRCENVSCCSNCDSVNLEPSYETENYLVCDDYGNELGELGSKAVEWIDENEDNIKFSRINNIEETDSGSYKADIEIFYK